ncbi:hypothetical protein ABGB09_29765 [Streptomyces sp. B8F3]|uniref:hypothetical protein n=1 Tax=Streptomyces sp. B8F3 TaxID=3153573 RepID=UPI00325D6ECC
MATNAESASGRDEPPTTGDLLVDRRTGRPGCVVRVLDEYARLRPLVGGGRPWIVPLPAVRPPTDDERCAAVRHTGRVLIWRGEAW